MYRNKLKLAPSVLKKYEQGLGLYCFYNSKEKLFWNCDYATGSVVASLDGSLTVEEVLDTLLSVNQGVDVELFTKTLLETFVTLEKEGFLIVVE